LAPGGDAYIGSLASGVEDWNLRLTISPRVSSIAKGEVSTEKKELINTHSFTE
jgi:hypothetical protein